MLALQPAEHRVALAGRKPLARRVVEGQDAAHLAGYRGKVGRRFDSRGDSPVSGLNEMHPRVVAHVVGDECHTHLAHGGAIRLRPPRGRTEPEARRCGEGERRVPIKLYSDRHVTDGRTGP